MNLYATTTSERATKGQGGNRLDIEIMGKNQVVIARIQVRNSYPYEYDMKVFPVVYPYPDKTISSSTLKLDVLGHGYKLTRRKTKATTADITKEKKYSDIIEKEEEEWLNNRKGNNQKDEILEPWDIKPEDNKIYPRSRQFKSWPKGL